MSYYCKECWNWINSRYEPDRDGWRYCDYSKKYEKPDQNIYGCRGFVYIGRIILTKVCTILDLPKIQWFEAFDSVKDSYINNMHPEWLTHYCLVGPQIAAAFDADPEKKLMAQNMMDKYIHPAYKLYEDGKQSDAASMFRDMVHELEHRYI